jgi:chromosome segregation ATPase
MPHDDLEHIPSIVPTRDGMPERGDARPRTTNRNEGNRQPNSQKHAVKERGTGVLTRLFVFVSLIVAVAACAWAWRLQAQLMQADERIADYATRIGDLEARLSDTDEGMSQNAEVQAAKLSELDKEVRKLWDNVWKETKDRLSKLEAGNASQDKNIGAVQGSVSTTQSQAKATSAEVAGLKTEVAALKGEIAGLKSVAGDMARLMNSAKANQTEVERVADTLNQINLSLAKLDKRVASNEEWVASINTFRKQINTSVSELQAAVRAQSAAN